MAKCSACGDELEVGSLIIINVNGDLNEEGENILICDCAECLYEYMVNEDLIIDGRITEIADDGFAVVKPWCSDEEGR